MDGPIPTSNKTDTKQILFLFKRYCNLAPRVFSMECGRGTPVILLQIVMVSPGTHFLKNHESQLKKNNESEIDNGWAFM